MKSSRTRERLTSPASPEARLVECALRRVRSRPGVGAQREVVLLGRVVDLAFLLGRRIFTVEFKLRDWRRAVAQARDHQLGADYAYICMPERRITPELNAELAATGVGLFFYDAESTWPFRVAVPAKRSTEKWSVAHDRLLADLHSARLATT